MNCFGIKKFLSRTCCSCRSGDSSATDEVQITKISKISASGSVHSVLGTTNGKDHAETKKIPANGTENPAFQTDEFETKTSTQVPSEKIVNEQPKSKSNAPYERQLSQISDISDFSPVADKGLAEMVLEDLEKSFSQNQTLKELQKSFRNEEELPEEIAEGNEEDELTGNDPIQAGESETEPKQEEQNQNVQPVDKHLEWRAKLMQELDNDEEFVLTSSEEEDDQEASGDEIAKKRAKTEDDSSAAVNENTKATTSAVENSVKSDTSRAKCDGVPVVIDAGSYEIRAGLAGEYAPEHQFRTVVGTWRSQVGEVYRETQGQFLFGDDALSKHNALSLKHPIQDGVVEDWKDFQSILDYTLSDRLQVDVKDHPLLVTEPTDISKKQRERKLEVVMEALHCPMIQFKSQAILSALTAGSDVSLVISSGHGYTEVVPVYHGYAIQHAVQRVNIGGRHITEYLARLLLKERAINFSSVADLLVLDEIKRRYAEVKNEDAFRTEAWNKMIQHEMPDGGIVELGAEIYRCTEPMFDPGLIGDSDGRGLIDLIQQSVKSVDPEIRSELKRSVLLSGANCGLKGFKRQLAEKLQSGEKTKKSKSGKEKSWRVTSCEDLTNSTWIGGSVYANSDDFRVGCVTDDEYFESGPSIIHRKCF